MSEWIDINVKTPSPGEEIWLYDKEDGVIIGTLIWGRFAHIYGNSDGIGYDTFHEVTHWMPMDKPKPPISAPE